MRRKIRSLFFTGIVIFLVVLLGLLSYGVLTTHGSELSLRAFLAWKMPACRVAWQSAEGNLFEQLTLREVEVKAAADLSSKPRALIQKIDIYFVSLRPEGLNIEFTNGRFFSGTSEPLVFNGFYQDRALDAELFLSPENFSPESVPFDLKAEPAEGGPRFLGKIRGMAIRISLKGPLSRKSF